MRASGRRAGSQALRGLDRPRTAAEESRCDEVSVKRSTTSEHVLAASQVVAGTDVGILSEENAHMKGTRGGRRLHVVYGRGGDARAECRAAHRAQGAPRGV